MCTAALLTTAEREDSHTASKIARIVSGHAAVVLSALQWRQHVAIQATIVTRIVRLRATTQLSGAHRQRRATTARVQVGIVGAGGATRLIGVSI